MDNTPQERYFDRELSWIRFNARVLAEGMDLSNPILERLKFIGIGFALITARQAANIGLKYIKGKIKLK